MKPRWQRVILGLMILIVAGLTIGQLSFTSAQNSIEASAGPDLTVPGPSPVMVWFDGDANVIDYTCEWRNQWGLLRASSCDVTFEVNFGNKDAKAGAKRSFTLTVTDLEGRTAKDRLTITLGESQAVPPPAPEPPEEPTCPEPTATASASSAYPGETITVTGDVWLPGGTVTLSLRDGGAHIDLGAVSPVPDSGQWETKFTVPDEPWGYWLTSTEDHEGCNLYVQSFFAINDPLEEEGDPLKDSTFISLTTHSYRRVDSSHYQWIDTGFIDGNRFYIRSNSTEEPPGAVECYEALGRHWRSAEGGGSDPGSAIEGCVGERDFFDSGIIGISPNYDGDVIASWSVWSGEETLARITPASGHSYTYDGSYTVLGQD